MVFQCPQFDPVPMIIHFFVFFKKNVIFTAGSTFCALVSGQLMQKMMMKCNTVKSRLESTQHSCLRSISAVILRFGTHKTRPLTDSRNPPRGTLKPSQVLASIDLVQLCFMESFRGWIIYIWVMKTVLSTTEDAHRQKKQCPCGAVGVGTPGAQLQPGRVGSCLTPLHIHRRGERMISATRTELLTCKSRWVRVDARKDGRKQYCLWLDYWFMKISLNSGSPLFPWQHHTAGESVSAPIRLVTAAEDRVRASQIIKSLMLAQCYWLMVHCVSWAADSEAFIFHQSCAAIRWGFQPREGAAATLCWENFCFQQVESFKVNKWNANERETFPGGKGSPQNHIGLNSNGNFFDHQVWLSDTHLGDCQWWGGGFHLNPVNHYNGHINIAPRWWHFYDAVVMRQNSYQTSSAWWDQSFLPAFMLDSTFILRLV